MTDSKEVLIPIIVGVTGHRDLRKEDIPDLEEKVRGIFQEIRNKYENTPIKVLSPLAEGADRLVANIGMEMGSTLIVPLPMPRSEYKKDFETEDSKKEFANLLSQAEVIYELPLLEGNTLENIQGNSENRNKQYAYVGAYVALHSQILIALWNGGKSEDTGSTAEVVNFKLEGVPEPYAAANHPLDLPDNGPVYHIFTQRERKQTEIIQNNHDLEVKYLLKRAKAWDVLYPAGWKGGSEGQAEEYYDRILKRIDEFNHDIKTLSASEKAKVNKSWVLPKEKQETLLQGMKELLDYFGVADVTAMHYQKQADKALKWLLSAPVIAFFFFAAFDELWSMAYMLALFPIFFGVAYLLYKIAAKKGYDNRFSDYRSLAEGLRVQFFWKLIGSKENVTDHYHRKYKADMAWIFQAIKNVSIKTNMETLGNPPCNKREILELVNARWIEDQRNYFEKNTGKRKANAEAQERFTFRFFAMAMVLVIGIFTIKAIILLQQGALDNLVDMNDIKNWTLYSVFLVLIDTFIATGAARSVYVEKKGFREEVKQFQRMKNLFDSGSKVMADCLKRGNLIGAEKLVIELGKEAITENGDWLILRRSKPMEVPLG